ncbi:MAG: ArsR family transcriptional regulator [Ktedonobacteraceae bacterium]
MSVDDTTPLIHSSENSPVQRIPEIDQFVDHFLGAMCDRSRRQILELLTIPGGTQPKEPLEWRSGDIARALKLSPATISGHLKLLSGSGLVTSRRTGNVVYYSVQNYMLVRAFQGLLLALYNEYNARETA